MGSGLGRLLLLHPAQVNNLDSSDQMVLDPHMPAMLFVLLCHLGFYVWIGSPRR